MSFKVKVVKLGGEGAKKVKCNEGDTVEDALEDTPWDDADTVMLNGSTVPVDTELDPEANNTISINKNVSGG